MHIPFLMHGNFLYMNFRRCIYKGVGISDQNGNVWKGREFDVDENWIHKYDPRKYNVECYK